MMGRAERMAKVMSSIGVAVSLFLGLTSLALAQGPTLTATDPQRNEVGVPLTHTISLTYNQAIDAATVNTGTLVAQGMRGGLLSGTYSVNGQNITLTSARPLFPNEIVRTTATGGLQNLTGAGAAPYQ